MVKNPPFRLIVLTKTLPSPRPTKAGGFFISIDFSRHFRYLSHVRTMAKGYRVDDIGTLCGIGRRMMEHLEKIGAFEPV